MKRNAAFTRSEKEMRWYVMRDLKRTNAKVPAYKLLKGMKMEVFVPMKWHLVTRKGIRIREEVPFIQDLLFVHETVADRDMERFIRAVNATESPRYYLPEEITPTMYGRKIRIEGGPLSGYEGRLLTTRGSKVKRLLVELEGFLAVGVEVDPEYIQLI